MGKGIQWIASDIDKVWISFEQKEYGDAEITTIVRCLTSMSYQRYVYASTTVNGFECCLLLSTPDEINVMRDRGLFSEWQEVMGTAICREFVACMSDNTRLWLAKKSGDNTKLFSKLLLNVYCSGNQQQRRYLHYATVIGLRNAPVIIKMKTSSTRKNKNHRDAKMISLKKGQILCQCPNDKQTHDSPANYQNIEGKPIQVTDGREQATEQQSDSRSNNQAVDNASSLITSARETTNSRSHPNRINDNVLRDQHTSSSHVHGKCCYPSYDTYDERISSFEGWKHHKPTIDECANAGFFLKGPGDLVRCFCCGIGLKDFSEADEPMEEHIKYSSKCAYLETLFGAEELKRRLEVIQSMEPENIRQKQYMEFKTNQGNDFTTKPHRHPEMSSSEKRLETFRHPNFQSVISPKRMADAGLYFTGERDLVRCFACDGGFRNWEQNDDPWTEHCRWFPSCRFAREVKGDVFIEQIQRQTPGARPRATNTEAETGHKNDLMVDSDIEMLRVTIVDDMGFSDETFKTAIRQVKKNGTIPSIDNVIAFIESMQLQGTDSNGDTFNQDPVHDDPITENQRLKNLLLCMRCKSKDANVLFLPCAHHRLCTDCAPGIEKCPVCQQTIQTSVQTFLS